jgi:AraC-like DNA-binding protein
LPNPANLGGFVFWRVVRRRYRWLASSMDALEEFRTLILRHAHGGIRRSILDGVSIAAVDAPAEPIAAIAEPAIAVVGQGVKRTTLNGTAYDYGAGQYLVASIELPVFGGIVEASPEAPFVVFNMSLKPALIAALLLETNNTTRPPAFSGIAVSDVTPELLDPIVRLLRLLDHPDDVRALGPGLEREILWRLIKGDQGPIVRQIGLADGSLAHIARTIRWIREHFAEPVLVEELAALSGMSSSSFHRHFRAATSMSPIQFQKQIRLQEARALLLARSGDVTQVAYAVGYESPSQFSREYRRAFGVAPVRDVAAGDRAGAAQRAVGTGDRAGAAQRAVVEISPPN